MSEPSAPQPPSIKDVIAEVATPILAQQTQQAQIALKDTIAATHARSLELISNLSDRLTKAEASVADFTAQQAPAIGQQAVIAIKSSLNNAAHDVWVPRLVVGIFGLAGLIILGAYVAGSHQAADIWVWLVATFGGAVLIGARMLLATILGTPPTPAQGG